MGALRYLLDQRSPTFQTTRATGWRPLFHASCGRQLCIRASFNEGPRCPKTGLPVVDQPSSSPPSKVEGKEKRRERERAQVMSCSSQKRKCPLPSPFLVFLFPALVVTGVCLRTPCTRVRRRLASSVTRSFRWRLFPSGVAVYLPGILPLDSEDPGLCEVVRAHEHYLGMWQFRRAFNNSHFAGVCSNIVISLCLL